MLQLLGLAALVLAVLAWRYRQHPSGASWLFGVFAALLATLAVSGFFGWAGT